MTILQPHQGSSITPRFDRATVADVMHAGVVSCAAEAPATDVARIMASRHIHAVVIGHDDGWRVVTDADVLRWALHGLEDLTAARLTGSAPVTVDPAASLEDAARLMLEHGVAHLVVAEGDRPVGVLSTLDIAGVLAWGRG